MIFFVENPKSENGDVDSDRDRRVQTSGLYGKIRNRVIKPRGFLRHLTTWVLASCF